MIMDIEWLMQRYDALVARNALLQAELAVERQKAQRLDAQVVSLRDDLSSARMTLGKMEGFNAHAREAGDLADHFPEMEKIEMIKEVRRRVGWGLKEAKDAVEDALSIRGRLTMT